jgi:uncharacterized UBP type Zn finger protein
VKDDVPVNSKTLFLTDFMNLKIKSTQSFGDVYSGKLCVHMFIGVSTNTSISICICTVFFKKKLVVLHYFSHLTCHTVHFNHAVIASKDLF